MRGDFDEDELDDDAGYEFDRDDDNTCQRCGGDGGYHDCGDDTCCCADPLDEDSDDWLTCEECGGSGYVG